MRLERSTFWRLATINIAVAMATVLLLPAGLSLPLPAVHGFPMAPLPLKFVAAYFLCLPVAWLGMQRLHDVGKAGWHAWLPMIAFACVTFGPDLFRPLLLQAVIWAQHHDDPVPLRRIGMAAVIGLWLCALLVMAGTLRTIFYWLQSGETGDNRHGPASTHGPVPVSMPVQRAPGRFLTRRMPRQPFWLLLIANVALAYGANHLMDNWLDLKPSGSIVASLISTLFYLPAFAAAVLRLHDRGQSGILPGLVLASSIAAPLAEHWLDHSQINWMNAAVDIVTIYLLFQCWQPGDADGNRYGPPPGGAPMSDDLMSSPARVTQPPPARHPVHQAVTRPSAAKPGTRQGFGRRGV